MHPAVCCGLSSGCPECSATAAPTAGLELGARAHVAHTPNHTNKTPVPSHTPASSHLQTQVCVSKDTIKAESSKQG